MQNKNELSIQRDSALQRRIVTRDNQVIDAKGLHYSKRKMECESFCSFLNLGEPQVAYQSTECPKCVLPVRREDSEHLLVDLERSSLIPSKVTNSNGISHPVWQPCTFSHHQLGHSGLHNPFCTS